MSDSSFPLYQFLHRSFPLLPMIHVFLITLTVFLSMTVGTVSTTVIPSYHHNRPLFAQNSTLSPYASDGSLPGIPLTITANHIIVTYDFDQGTEDWGTGNTGSVGKGGEIMHDKQGYLRLTSTLQENTIIDNLRTTQTTGTITTLSPTTAVRTSSYSSSAPAYPWIDSPIGIFNVSDATYVLIRMKHYIVAHEGKLWFRRYNHHYNTTRNDTEKDIHTLKTRYEWRSPQAAPVYDPTDGSDVDDDGYGTNSQIVEEGDYWEQTFPLYTDGKWHTYAIPIQSIRYAVPTMGVIFTQLRLYPAIIRSSLSSSATSDNPALNSIENSLTQGTIVIDYIRIVTAPTILKVEGCSRVEFPVSLSSFTSSSINSPSTASTVTDLLPPNYVPMIRTNEYALNQYYSSLVDALQRTNASTDTTLPYASTYNCGRYGGERIVISGVHFGKVAPRVLINGVPCTNVELLQDETIISCISPPGNGIQVAVTVSNGIMPALSDTKPYFSYQNGPKAPPRPVISNIQTHAVDISWLPPQNPWEAMMVTGYIVQWRVAILDDYSVGSTENPFTKDSTIGTGSIIGVGASGWVAERPLGTEDSLESPELITSGSSTPILYTSAIDNAAIDNPAAAELLFDVITIDKETTTTTGSTSTDKNMYRSTSEIRTRGVKGTYGPNTERIAPDIVWGLWGEAPGGGEIIVTNQTTVTIRGLEAGRRYQFRIASLNEPVSIDSQRTARQATSDKRSHPLSPELIHSHWFRGDMYGLRSILPSGVRGPWSFATEDCRTLLYDVLFTRFDANATLDHGPLYANSTVNSLHWSGGEGHYGLILVGSAHIGNCNSTHTCCDNFGGEEGTGKFYDIVRYLENWSQANTHAPDYEYDNTYVHPPFYRYNSDTHDYSPVPLEWNRLLGNDSSSTILPLHTRTNGNSSNDTLSTSNGNGTNITSDQSIPSVASSSSLSSLPLYDTIPSLGSNLNQGTLPEYFQTSNVGRYSVAKGTSEIANTHKVAGSSREPVLHRGRLLYSDILLSNALGKKSTYGSWFSLLKEESSRLWEEYDDAGNIVFIPSLLYQQLEAAEIYAYLSNRTFNISKGVEWVGIYDDSRVSWEEAAYRGPLDFSSVIIDTTTVNNASFTNYTVPTNNLYNSSNITDSMPPLHAISRSDLLSFYNNSRYQYPYRSLRDRYGRRLVGLPKDPTSSCTLVCTAASSLQSAYLNQQAIRNTDVYPKGYFYDSNKPSLSSAYDDGEGSSSSTVSNPGIDEIYEDSRNLVQRDSLRGIASILGINEQSRNYSQTKGLPYRTGAHPNTRAPITGRYSRTVSSSAAASMPYPDTSFPSSIAILPASVSGATYNATAPCGPVLRLTSSQHLQTGSAWYGRPQQVREGFDTTFIFRIANPSVYCHNMHDIHTRCVSRGGTGFAFVLQTMHPGSLGNTSNGLGYEGIRSSLAIELDTYTDPTLLDPGNNHVSIQSRGISAGNSANHTFTFATAPFRNIPDLTDGIHIVRIRYEPLLTPNHIQAINFVTTTHATDMFFTSLRHTPTSATDSNTPSSSTGTSGTSNSKGGSSFSGIGSSSMGVISVYLDDENVPILVTPMQLSLLLGLDETHGRAWIGFTAATGSNIWQNHDILAWHFTQLRM